MRNKNILFIVLFFSINFQIHAQNINKKNEHETYKDSVKVKFREYLKRKNLSKRSEHEIDSTFKVVAYLVKYYCFHSNLILEKTLKINTKEFGINLKKTELSFSKIDYQNLDSIYTVTLDENLLPKFPESYGKISNEEAVQGVPEFNNSDEILAEVDKLPQFIGGEDSLIRFINYNLVYPLKARNKKKEGTVIVEFIIEIDGTIKNTKIIKGFDKECNDEAERVIKSFPKWIPGESNGMKTRVKYTLPITFEIKNQRVY